MLYTTATMMEYTKQMKEKYKNEEDLQIYFDSIRDQLLHLSELVNMFTEFLEKNQAIEESEHNTKH